MRTLSTCLIWVFVIGAGTGGSKLYKQWIGSTRVPLADRVKSYDLAWQNAVEQATATPPPSLNEAGDETPSGHQNFLRQRLAAVDLQYRHNYEQKVEDGLADLQLEFRDRWMKAFDELADTPSIDQFLLQRGVHSYHQERLRARLVEADQELG